MMSPQENRSFLTLTSPQFSQREIGIGTRQTCSLCGVVGHPPSRCPQYSTPGARRRRFAKQQKCFNCLMKGHKAQQCKSLKRCLKCGGKHHYIICYHGDAPIESTHEQIREGRTFRKKQSSKQRGHFPLSKTLYSGVSSRIEDKPSESIAFDCSSTSGLKNVTNKSHSFFCRAMVKPKHDYQKMIEKPVLFDQASQTSCQSDSHFGEQKTPKVTPTDKKICGCCIKKNGVVSHSVFSIRIKRMDNKWEEILPNRTEQTILALTLCFYIIIGMMIHSILRVLSFGLKIICWLMIKDKVSILCFDVQSTPCLQKGRQRGAIPQFCTVRHIFQIMAFAVILAFLFLLPVKGGTETNANKTNHCNECKKCDSNASIYQTILAFDKARIDTKCQTKCLAGNTSFVLRGALHYVQPEQIEDYNPNHSERVINSQSSWPNWNFDWKATLWSLIGLQSSLAFIMIICVGIVCLTIFIKLSPFYRLWKLISWSLTRKGYGNVPTVLAILYLAGGGSFGCGVESRPIPSAFKKFCESSLVLGNDSSLPLDDGIKGWPICHPTTLFKSSFHGMPIPIREGPYFSARRVVIPENAEVFNDRLYGLGDPRFEEEERDPHWQERPFPRQIEPLSSWIERFYGPHWYETARERRPVEARLRGELREGANLLGENFGRIAEIHFDGFTCYGPAGLFISPGITLLDHFVRLLSI